jgi:hypothetical protein
VSLAALQPLAWCAAFWTALWLYERRARPARPVRFALGLVLGAALAHAGWLALHAPLTWPALRARPGLRLDPSRGYCVLFLPLGLLALERSGAALASLPLALAVARLGCLAAGCCGGVAAALVEIAGQGALAAGLASLDARRAGALALAGFGALRLVSELLRGAPPLGAPIVAPALLAAGWLVLGAGLFVRAVRMARSGRSPHEHDDVARSDAFHARPAV